MPKLHVFRTSYGRGPVGVSVFCTANGLWWDQQLGKYWGGDGKQIMDLTPAGGRFTGLWLGALDIPDALAVAGPHLIFSHDDQNLLDGEPETWTVAGRAIDVGPPPPPPPPPAPPGPVVVDVAGRNYAETGTGWQDWHGAGHAGRIRYRVAQGGTATASWRFDDLAPGQYTISATWDPPAGDHAPAARYRVFDGTLPAGEPLLTAAVDQRHAPAGPSRPAGAGWQVLGTIAHGVPGGPLLVVLDGSPTGVVVADAVMVEPEPLPTAEGPA
jgi:hypothetical protein